MLTYAWGDACYVGLNGIEVYDGRWAILQKDSIKCVFKYVFNTKSAALVCVCACVCLGVCVYLHLLCSGSLLLLEDNAEQITANPSDINVLEGYGSDPRTVDNLMDGVNCTCDDLNVWLAPFTPGTHFTCLTSTKVQILTPEELRRHVRPSDNRPRICTYVCIYACSVTTPPPGMQARATK